ncbi:MAG: cytochrome c oxidase subunit II [Thermoleophilia bacterium]|nr:cytochrome c oxidase subunit II [Thermoleophilia bacterium]
MGRQPLVAALAALAALALPAVAVAGSGGFAPPEPASPSAERIADIYWLILAFAGLVLLLVVVPLVLFAVRFRNRGGDRDVEGPQIRGNTNLEVAWTLVPVVILFVVGAFVFYKLPGITDPARAQDGRPVEVTVEGRQFYWRYVYDGGEVAIDRLRLPLGVEAELRLTAPEHDVLHSWWANELTGKRDTIPGQGTTIRIVPTREGAFTVRCGEFCGVQHSAMLGAVEVVPEDEFRRWLDERREQQLAGSPELGEELWTGACAKCHGEDVAGELAPPLQGNPVLRDADALRDVVVTGPGEMPPVGRGWTDGELDALTAYLRENLAGGTGGDGGEDGEGDGG